MNYIFGNNALYARASRMASGASPGQGSGLGSVSGSGHGSSGPKLKQWAKRSSSEEPPSRWQQLLTFFSRRSAFADCISAGACQVEPAGRPPCTTPPFVWGHTHTLCSCLKFSSGTLWGGAEFLCLWVFGGKGDSIYVVVVGRAWCF